MAAGSDPEQSQLALIDAGVDDIELESDRLIAYCGPHELMAVRAKAEGAGLTLLDARVGYIPKTLHAVDEVASSQLIRALEALEELDDVSTVETNADL